MLFSKLLLNKRGKKGRPKNQRGYNQPKIRTHPFSNTELSLVDQYSLVDTVMFLPINEKDQLHIYIFEIQGIRYIDFRIYSLNYGKFKSTEQGFTLPIDMLEQLTIRLNKLLPKQKENKDKVKYNFELDL